MLEEPVGANAEALKKYFGYAFDATHLEFVESYSPLVSNTSTVAEALTYHTLFSILRFEDADATKQLNVAGSE